jgi:hypothetical protein
LHFPRRQERRARHIPGPWYMPAILLTWWVLERRSVLICHL